MTLLDLSAGRTRHPGLAHRVGRAVQWTIATLQARAALARIVRTQNSYRLDDIPPHLRRDLGLPELDPAPWRPNTIVIDLLRTKQK